MEYWCCLDLFSHSLTHSSIQAIYWVLLYSKDCEWQYREQYTKHTNSAALLSHSSWYLGCLTLQQRGPDSYGFGCSVSFLCCPLLPFAGIMSLLLIWVTIAGIFYPWMEPTSVPEAYGMFPALPSSSLIPTMRLGSSLISFFLLRWLNSKDLIKLSGPKVSVTFFLERQSI